MVKKAISAIILCLAAVSCGRQAVRDGFTQEELSIICSPDSIMRVLTIEDSTDLTVLRSESRDIPAGSLLSDEYAMLAERMIATVTHPSQDGVGIAEFRWVLSYVFSQYFEVFFHCHHLQKCW